MATTADEKRARLARLLREKTRQTRQAPPSFAQERMWFLDQWSPGSALFNMPAVVRLTGALSLEALEHGLQALVDRHESLRTTLSAQDGQPVQVIAATLKNALAVEDLEGHPPGEREALAWKHISAEVQRPFELGQGPLMRTSLYRLSANEHLLLLNLHHIVADGWSMGVLVQDLAAFYLAAVEGQPAKLHPLPLQYSDFAVWQRQWLQGGVMESQLAFWRSRLDPNALLELPVDKPRTATLSSRGTREFLTLSPALTQALKDFSQHEGQTLFSVLLAAFQVLLHRYTGHTDLTVGTLVSGRSRAELEGLIGLFTNSLPLRTQLSGAPTFRELLGRVHETTLQAYENQDVPFEKLVEALNPERSSSHAPLFQVMIILQNAPASALQARGLVMDLLPATTGTAKHDLTLYAIEFPEGLRLSAEYSTDLFEAPTMVRMLGHLRRLLEGAVARPDTRITELPMLTDGERHQLLVDWNPTRADVPLDICFHQLFEAQAARTPQALAVADDGLALTYEALDRRANRLAHLLVDAGVGPDSLVALLAPRGADFLTAMLGILKAGGAWLPLDFNHPPQRLAQVLSQSGARLALVGEEFASLFASTVPLLGEKAPRALPLGASLAAPGSEDRLPPRSGPSNLAYVIFTSGSTGAPKGAMLQQRGMLNHLWAKVEALRLTPADAVAQTASPCFDISVWQFLVALLVGGHTRVYSDETAHAPRGLLEALQRDDISIAETVPSLLRAMLEEAEGLGAARPSLARLRWMIPTGEALPPEVVRRWVACWPSIPLLNAYGPTECSDDVTHHPLHSALASSVVPIGRPVLNTRLYVLDGHGQPTPIGIPGELYVGGEGVGRGYLGQPGLTAERFLPDDFSTTPGARLYRTGDRARWLPDGTLDFMGRLDFQVKLRGFRLELGEIEATLEQHADVRQAVVVVREDAPGAQRLVAYVVGQGGPSAVDTETLRAWLHARLPEYMVPSAFLVLEAMPLSANGKVERKALPAPQVEHAQEERVAPGTPTEVEVAALFGELLKVENVGAHDDLFRLGGNSLLATRVLARLRSRFGVELPLRVLFQHSTVHQLARLVDDTRAGTSGRPERASDAKRRERHPILPLRVEDAPEGPAAEVPGARAARAPQLTDAERHHLLVELNDNAQDFPRDACIQHLVEAQVRRTPDAVAVVAGDVRLTFRELDARANQLARHLRSLGVGPEVRVGICVERNADMVVGMLGILKTGAAYVPLDPTYPRERLAFLLEDARGPALVAHSHLLSSLPPHGSRPVCLDTDADVLARESDAPLPDSPDPLNLAYLIYTSGSTGRPKGVAITHRSAVAFLTWALSFFPREDMRCLMACTSINFDISIFEVFGTLCAGGTVIVTRNALALVGLPQANEITLLNTVPSAMAQLLRLGPIPPSVRTVNLAGETLPAPLARQVFAFPQVQRVYNLYGPSEDTTYSTYGTVRPGEIPNVGRQITNTQLYIVDEQLRPVPFGETGELYIAGEGLARGYLHRPDLTAERFIPNPFGAPGSRMYKTGDRIRYLPNTELEYLGRLDFQVKIRGFRIELGEVETVVQTQPGVREAVVVAREDTPGDKRLVAYATAVAGHTLDAATLREGIRKRLPEFMIPSAFVLLDAMPLNPNGKVDRKALPAPVLERTSLQPYEAPRTPTEELLAALWRQVLGVDRVGRQDHFFELGGHSLLATQVASRLRTSLRVELPLNAFFEAPTLEALAPRVDAARELAGAQPIIPPLLPVPRTGRLPLSFAQQRLWLLDRLEPGGSAYTILAALRLRGPLSPRALVRAFQALLQRHESLRTAFLEDDQGPLQVIQPDATPAMGLVDLTALPEPAREAEALALAGEEAERPFDLTKGPLVRGLLVKLEANHHVLVVTMHHIISDGWSSAVLIRELSSLYEAFSTSQSPQLPALPVQYADYTVWQRQWLKGDVLDAQLDYWRQQLAGAPPALELPTDRPRPPVQTFRGGRVPVKLGTSLSESIKDVCRREGVTPFMVLLAGLQSLLSMESGQLDVVVGSPIAGRGDADLEGLIGCFVNTLALRTRLDGALSFRELLSRVRDVTLGAYAHQDVPFERVVEAALPARDPSRSPLFQVLFVLENAPVSQPMGPGLTLNFMDVERHSAKFDLTLALWEEARGLTGVLEYNSDLFEPSTATRMAEHLRMLLEWSLAHLEAPLSQLRLGPVPAEVLVPLQPGGSLPPFFCVHAIGGTAMGYAELVRHLGPQQPFYGLQARGLHGGQPPLETVEEMAALYVEAMRTVQPHGPYRLGGWSMGAVVAFEMARLLQQQGEVVEQLLFIEPSPTSYAQGIRVDDAATLGSLFAANLAHTTGLSLELPTHVRPEDTDALLRHLLDEGRRTGVFGSETGVAQLQTLHRVFSACLRAIYGHTLRPLPLPLTMLRGTSSTREEDGDDGTRGWGALASRVERLDVPGDHFTVLQAPNVETLARTLSRVLAPPAPQAMLGKAGK